MVETNHIVLKGLGVCYSCRGSKAVASDMKESWAVCCCMCPSSLERAKARTSVCTASLRTCLYEQPLSNMSGLWIIDKVDSRIVWVVDGQVPGWDEGLHTKRTR